MPEIAKVIPVLELDLVMCNNHPDSTSFEGMKRSCRGVEAWHCERPERAIGEGSASVAVKSPGLKGYAKKLRFGTEPMRGYW